MRLTPEGRAVRGAGGAGVEGTPFCAARDAAEGRHWPRSGAALGQQVQRTQGRRVGYVAQLLGLLKSLPERTREHLATILSVPLLALQEGAERFAQGSWSERGRAVMSLLAQRGVRGRTWGALLEAGQVAGLWGRPSRWDPGGSGTMRRPG